MAPDGTLSNRRVCAQMKFVFTDGMCLDAEGQIWLANAFTTSVSARQRGRRDHRRSRRRARPLSPASWEVTTRTTLFVMTAPTSDRFEIADLLEGESRSVEVERRGRRYALAEFGKSAAQVANRLLRSHLVFNQREANVSVSPVTEANTGTRRHVGLFDEERRELE